MKLRFGERSAALVLELQHLSDLTQIQVVYETWHLEIPLEEIKRLVRTRREP